MCGRSVQPFVRRWYRGRVSEGERRGIGATPGGPALRRALLLLVALGGLAVAYVLLHWALIETGGEVIVLRTEGDDGRWLETRLWIVDEGGVAWLHGDRGSQWVRNLEARPVVEVVRAGRAQRYRATPAPGPHPRIHELMREKYGIADVWVRFVGADRETTTPIRLDALAPSP
jgi:hypothetical protein